MKILNIDYQNSRYFISFPSNAILSDQTESVTVRLIYGIHWIIVYKIEGGRTDLIGKRQIIQSAKFVS